MANERDLEIAREEQELLAVLKEMDSHPYFEDLDEEDPDNEEYINSSPLKQYQKVLECKKTGSWLSGIEHCTELLEYFGLDEDDDIYPFLYLIRAEFHLKAGNGKDASDDYEFAVSEKPVLKDPLFEKEIDSRLREEKLLLEELKRKLDAINITERQSWEEEIQGILNGLVIYDITYKAGKKMMEEGQYGAAISGFLEFQRFIAKQRATPADLCYKLALCNLLDERAADCQRWLYELSKVK